MSIDVSGRPREEHTRVSLRAGFGDAWCGIAPSPLGNTLYEYLEQQPPKLH